MSIRLHSQPSAFASWRRQKFFHNPHVLLYTLQLLKNFFLARKQNLRFQMKPSISITLKTLCAVTCFATVALSESISGADYYRYWMYFKSIKLNYDKAKINPEDYPDQVDEIGVNEHQQAQGIRSTSVKKAQMTEHFLPAYIIPYFESIYEADMKEKKQDTWSRHSGLKAHRQYIDWYEHKIMLEDKVNAPQYSKMQSLPNAYLRDELQNVNCQLKDDRQRLEYAQQQLRKHLEKEPPVPEIVS